MHELTGKKVYVVLDQDGWTISGIYSSPEIAEKMRCKRFEHVFPYTIDEGAIQEKDKQAQEESRRK